jgi:hypothetical protein
MKKLLSVITLTLLSANLFSQKIHSPAEILKLLENSTIAYNIKILTEPIAEKDYSEKLNSNNFYRVVTDTSLYTMGYKNDNPFFNRAEELFQTSKDSALYLYKLAYDADTSLYIALTYAGQLLDILGDRSGAMDYYKKAISRNYIDFMAHWFLADDYLLNGDVRKAVDEIVIAQILNRNNPRVHKSLKQIFAKAKNKTEDWYFNPQVRIQEQPDKTISVEMNENWFGYGSAKALWDFEPGYRASMGVDSGTISTNEYRECLISQVIAQENKKSTVKKYPQLRVLQDAAKNQFLDEYILYEIILPENPFVAYQLPEKTILSIKDYILKVRKN